MLTLLLTLVAQSAPVAAPVPACQYDRAAMLALDWRALDQDMAGGWRMLANAGCDAAAADLIAAWRAAHTAAGDPRAAPPGADGLLAWHEGQPRAYAGQTTAAITLFDRARKTSEEDRGFGWNLYVDGSIAFLRRDRAGLDAARTTLAGLPLPAGYAPVGPDGKPRAIRWPMNLNVLDGFQRCWGLPYKQAYACAKPMIPYTAPAAK